MTRAALALLFATLGACEPRAETVSIPTPGASASAPASPAAPAVIDARIELEEGPDPSFGEGASSVRAILVVAALQTRKQLFAVPSPYACKRRPGAELAIECRGDDGTAFATLRADDRRIVATARDYGRLDRNIETTEILVPANAVVNVYAPAKLP